MLIDEKPREKVEGNIHQLTYKDMIDKLTERVKLLEAHTRITFLKWGS